MKENFEERIREIAKLKDGWSSGVGTAFDPDHVEVATQLALRYHKKYNITVSGFPNEQGSIDLVFNVADVFLEVKILSTIHDIDVTFSEGINEKKQSVHWGSFKLSQMDDIMEKFIQIFRNAQKK